MKTKHKFTVEVIDGDSCILLVSKKEGDLIHHALMGHVFPPKEWAQDKKTTMEFDRLAYKIEEQLNLL